MSERRTLAAIMFTDIQGYTALMNANEKAALEFLRAHNSILDETSRHFAGEVIKSIGDSYLIVFGSAVNSAQAAWEAQQRFKRYNLTLGDGPKLMVRISIHLGDVVLKDGDVYGDGVNVASRLQGVTKPGGIVLSRDLFAQIRGKVPYAIRSMGLVELKGLSEPLEVFEVPTGMEEGGAPAPQADALVGRHLGPCQLEQVIGRGGMGTVYRGRHLALNRAVAVKVLSADALTEAAADRLLAEARTAAAIEDPHIVQIYDAGRQGALRYVVMQLIEGETLDAMVTRAGPLPPEKARKIMREVLLGLSAAHKKGLVHRDVKPANIMVDAAGMVKILDFGLAAPIGRAAGSSPSDEAAGSFDFMAPEQGFDAAPSPAQDLYAFGSTYFFCLSGLPPFSGGSAADMLLMHREAPVPDIRAANREVTTQTAELIKRLMDKDPARRPASADAILAELDAPGMLIELDAERSPFKILPPPPEPEPVGLAADPVVQQALRAAPEVAAAARAPVLPPPPPPPPEAALGMSPAAKALFAAVFIALFGRHWLVLVSADWLGAATACAAGLCALALLDGPAWARRLVSTALFAGLSWSLWSLAGPGAAAAGVEVLVAAGLGITLGLAGLLLGFWTAARDRPLGCALLAASALALLVVAAGLPLPAGTSWVSGVPLRLEGLWSALRASGGLHRWASVAAAFFLFGVGRLSLSR
jgi:class 3 adenylate cyclase